MRPEGKNTNLKDFFYDIRYIIVFYVMGDILTTIFALETGTGYEGNFIIAVLLENYGFYSVIVLKMLFLSFCFADYLYLKNNGYFSTWNFTRHSIALMGLVVVINNLLVISGAGSPLYALLYGL